MITAVDTNVLLDVFSANDTYGPASREALATCLDQGLVVLCDVVWAEVTAAFPRPEQAQAAVLDTGATFTPIAASAASLAGHMWSEYRRGGGPRSLVIADFLIGAHALDAADQLLTRDRGFYRRYFTELTVVDPTT